MLKTEYFVGTQVNYNPPQIEASIAEAQRKKAQFITTNKEIIARVVSEDLIIAPYSGNSIIVPIIKLSYFEK